MSTINPFKGHIVSEVGHILSEPQQTGFTLNQVSMSSKIMYSLYKEMCIDESIELVKISMYRHITITVYNLSFHQRKSYRSYICEDFILVVAETQNQVTDEFKLAFDKHV